MSPAEALLMVGMSELTPESLVDRLGMSLVAVASDVVDVEDSPSLADVCPMVGISSLAVAVAVAVSSLVAAAEVVSSS